MSYDDPQYTTDYRGFGIRKIKFAQGYLINGHKVHDGYIAIENHAAILPGGTWAQTVEGCQHLIDDFIAAREEVAAKGGEVSDIFWARVRVRRAAEQNALAMAVVIHDLMNRDADVREVAARMHAILDKIDDSADTRTIINDVAAGTIRRDGPKGRTGLDYLG